MKNPTSNDDDRTTPFGLFNYAHSYWRSAVALQNAKVKATHPDAPITFLYIHAIELFLKSYLRLNGMSVKELRSRKYGHQVCCLADKAHELGLHFDDEDKDKEVLSLIVLMNITDVRYIKTGAFTRPTPDALDRTCKSFYESVEKALHEKGIKTRRYP